jgi:hypothetical protein
MKMTCSSIVRAKIQSFAAEGKLGEAAREENSPFLAFYKRTRKGELICGLSRIVLRG